MRAASAGRRALSTLGEDIPAVVLTNPLVDRT
jgi:hypothetical protein